MTLVISLKFGTWRRWSQIKRFTEKLDCIFQERSHSIPGSKPPLIRALGAYEEYLSQHKKGVFRRKRISLASMMSWSKVCFFFRVAEEPKISVCAEGQLRAQHFTVAIKWLKMPWCNSRQKFKLSQLEKVKISMNFIKRKRKPRGNRFWTFTQQRGKFF